MNINNRYTVNPLYNGSQEYDTEDEKSSSGKTTIIYQGGDGLTSELKEKLNSIEKGALVNQDAFSYVKLSDGAISQTIDARLPKDTVNLTVSGKGGIRTELTTIYEIDNLQIASTSELNKGVYLFNYSRLETIVPPPEESPSGTEPTTVVTWPLTMKYVSGPTLTKSDFTHMLLFSKGELQWEFAKDKLTITEIESIVDTISISQLNFYFDQVRLINVTTVADKIITTVVCLFDKVLVYKFNTILISSQTDDLWKLDKDGNLYTDRNLYSTKEVSAYGVGTGGGTGGAGALYECADVLRDGDKVLGAIDGSLLSYNGSHWRAIPQSAITPDLSGYVKTTQIGAANGIAPLDGNRLIPSTYLPSYVDDVVEVDTYATLPTIGQSGKIYVTLDTNLTYRWSGSNYVEISKSLALGYTNSTAFPGDEGLTNTNNIAALKVLLDMFEWDKTDPNNWRIKAKKDLYSVGEVSAYGIGIGEMPVGALYLYELKDVLLTNLTNGQLLKYNGTKWVNINSNEVGLNELQLGIYLATNNYAKKSDIPSLTGYATESWVTQLNFAKKATIISAGDGLVGGGDLSANRSLSLATTGTSGTYSKVTTDMYGRVTSGTSATISDIVGLTSTLASKLNVSDFEKWFTIKYNTDGTINSIQANFNFYSVGEVSAYGVGQGETPAGALYLHELKDVTITDILNNQLLSYNTTLGKWINSNKPTYSYSEITGTPPVVDLSNYVTLNSAQVISGQKTFTSPVFLNHSVIGDAPDNISFYTKQFGGQGINMRSLLVSADYSLRNLVPDQGAYFVGDVKANSFAKHGGTADQVLRADGGVSTFSFVGQAGQPAFVWGSDGTPYNYKVWNPANFNVATSVSSTKIKPTGGGAINVNTLYEDNYIRFYNVVSIDGSVDLFPTYNNANGILSFSTHPGGYGHQIGFSGNGDLYNRYISSDSWQGTWKKILNEGNWHSVIDGRYLPLTGGTVTGALTVNQDIKAGHMGWKAQLSSSSNTNEVLFGLALPGNSNNAYIRLGMNKIEYFNGANNTIWHSGNDGTGSGLDADMLDGLHLKQITKYPAYNYTEGCLVYTDILAITDAMCSVRIRGNSYRGITSLPIDSYIEFYNYNSGNAILDATALHNGYNFGDIHVFTFAGNVCLWFKQAANFQSFEVEVVQTNGVNVSYNRVTYIENTVKPSNIQRNVIITPKQSALITSNVASATVLQTARSIWGQPFKGDSNIEGPMYGVRSITGLTNTAIDYVSQVGHYFYSYNKPTPLMSLLDGYVGISTTNPQWTFHVNGDIYTHEWFRVKHSRGLYIQDASVYYTNSANYACVSSNGNEIVFSGADDMYVNYRGDGTTGRAIPKKWYWRAGTSDSWAGMEIGNLGVNGDIGVSGNLYSDLGFIRATRIFTGFDAGVTYSMSCSNWFRSNGSSGWFSSDYGGGIHMQDSTYVRIYNSKALAVDSTSFSAINNQGGYYSNKNNSYENLWVNSLDPTKAIFNAATTLGVGTNSYRNMIGWIDQINNVGYLTRYSIGSVRRDSGWGEMALCVGNNDNGTSANLLLLGGNGDARWSGTFYSTSIIADDVLKSTAGRLDLGPVSIQYDSTNRAIKFIMSDGTPCNIYATGDVAAYAMSGIGVLNLSYTFGNKLFVDSTKSTTVDAQPLISLAIGNNNTGLDWANNNAINLRANNIQIAYWDVNSFAVTKRLDVFEQATFNSNVGIGSIGMSTPLKLTVVGNIIASGTITANTSASDKRLKCNIRNFEAKDIIKSLAPKTYKWNEIARSRADVFNTDNTQYGLIYQDIKDNMYVSEYALDNMFGDEYGMIAYDRFIPIILQGEIELYDEVSLLKDRIKVLEDKLKMTEQK